MPSIINSDNGAVSGSAGLKFDSADDGILHIQNSGNTAIAIANTGQATFTHALSQPGGFSFRNKIINGDMRIDQRGTSFSPSTDSYILDRWLLRQPTAILTAAKENSVVPDGFASSLKITVASALGSVTSNYVVNLEHRIEGNNVGDLGWGTSNAKTITMSFWIRSSVTGTYSVSLYNSSFGRAYVTTYTINSANTWELKTITISGDQSGTWLKDNGSGIIVSFDLGCGSNYNGTANTWGSGATRTSNSVTLDTNAGATWYVTGVQLEVGSVATPFEQRPVATEMNLCTRYFYRMGNGINNFLRYAVGDVRLSTEVNGVIYLPNVMRATPTATVSSASHFAISEANTNRAVTSFGIATMPANPAFIFYNASVASGLTAGRCAQLISNNTQSSFIDFSAEL